MRSVIMNRITKIYPGGNRAVSRLSLSLNQGEVFGFLGPNGAGKTTTVKLLTGMLSPSDGNCEVMGIDPSKEPEKVHALSGVVTEHARMYDHLTGMENLIFYGSLFGLGKEEARQRAENLLKRLALYEAENQRLSAYSTGMRQRLSLARALLHRPRVLFLDEPTIGLDAVSKLAVRSFIRRLNETRRITVILTTHDMQDIEALASRILLIGKGKILLDGTLDDIRQGGESIDETLAALYQQYEI